MIEFLGDRIQNARELRNLSAKEASKLCNVSKSSWSLYESNKRTPSLDVLKHIAKKLNVSADYLLGLSDDIDLKQRIKE
ncbi:transcriptional regulator [Bacillus sp. FJAT-27225]|uniref:helix-turn-helix domain-containing protein n=1 Tax=Bacillus sp. FJAT-27225 TaxID=1743144 RepID=UPI00080C2283|nr:helix-turn-helix transcriptional regulator [Bacillus sp. FJAT-27225]OCA86018.1 transcriptional regulator [Bacillus sp. FJAT-27225]